MCWTPNKQTLEKASFQPKNSTIDHLIAVWVTFGGKSTSQKYIVMLFCLFQESFWDTAKRWALE
mgnify:CR=1 FL=1